MRGARSRGAVRCPAALSRLQLLSKLFSIKTPIELARTVYVYQVGYFPRCGTKLARAEQRRWTQLGVAVQLTANTFLIVLGAVALAGAIAFGIGGREVARDILEKAYNRSSDEVEGGSTTQGTSTRSTAAGGREGDSGPSFHRQDRNE